MGRTILPRAEVTPRGYLVSEEDTVEGRVMLRISRGYGTVGASSSDAVEFHAKITNIIIA